MSATAHPLAMWRHGYKTTERHLHLEGRSADRSAFGIDRKRSGCGRLWFTLRSRAGPKSYAAFSRYFAIRANANLMTAVKSSLWLANCAECCAAQLGLSTIARLLWGRRPATRPRDPIEQRKLPRLCWGRADLPPRRETLPRPHDLSLRCAKTHFVSFTSTEWIAYLLT